MTNINLVEWQTLRPSEVGFLKGLVPTFDKRAAQTADELASSDKLEILQLRSGIEIRATSWVGRVTLGDLTITVRPKIEGAPLLNLLRYAYSLRDLETFTPTGYETATEAFQDLIVEQLANEATELISRGLHRDYLRFNAELASPTGRIDFAPGAVRLSCREIGGCLYLLQPERRGLIESRAARRTTSCCAG